MRLLDRAEARVIGTPGIGREQMGPNLFLIEILGTHLGPTLRSELLRFAPICSELLY